MKYRVTVCIVVASIITILYSIRTTFSFRIVFCDVGQGAATLLQAGTYQMIIDTGPDRRILSCIGRHIPFFDRTIETIIISHAQKDHNGGLGAIQHKYKVIQVIGEIKTPTTISFHNCAIKIVKASQSSKNANDAANVVTIKTPLHTIFITSDINGVELKQLMPISTSILVVPHHGSKYGLYPDSLDLAHPSLAVISVGKKNSYGHPSKDSLAILKAKKIPIWRTDEKGELVIDLNARL